MNRQLAPVPVLHETGGGYYVVRDFERVQVMTSKGRS